MGHPHVSGSLVETLNVRQGKTMTINQLSTLTGLSHAQIVSAMRTVVNNSNGRVVVVTRARAWRMISDAELLVSQAAPQEDATVPKPRAAAKKAEETPQKAGITRLELEILGKTSDGGQIGRDESGQMWGVRKL